MAGGQSIFYLSVCLLDLQLLSTETYAVCSRCCGCPSRGPGLPYSGALSLTSNCQVSISVLWGFWLLLESALLPGQQAEQAEERGSREPLPTKA